MELNLPAQKSILLYLASWILKFCIPTFFSFDSIILLKSFVLLTKLASAKEQYKLEYTEEERNALIGSDLETVDKAIQFNSVPQLEVFLYLLVFLYIHLKVLKYYLYF